MSADGKGAAYSTSEFFEDLDREFTNLKTIEDETFRYKGADVIVQGTWELPIIIQWPGSSINFEFSTKGGGIEFGIVFVPALEDDQDQDELNVETVEEMSRVRSDAEKIEGTFSPPSEGVVFFLWDNTYDWTAVKKLSYSVDVFQPSFTLPDADRCDAAKNLLLDILEDSETAAIRQADAEDQVDYYLPNAVMLESQCENLQMELSAKIAKLRELEKEEDELITMINTNYESIPGIGIRCLNKHLLSVVLGFLDPYHGVCGVSKYWREIALASRVQIVSGPEPVFHVKPDTPRFVKRAESNAKRVTTPDYKTNKSSSGSAGGGGGGGGEGATVSTSHNDETEDYHSEDDHGEEDEFYDEDDENLILYNVPRRVGWLPDRRAWVMRRANHGNARPVDQTEDESEAATNSQQGSGRSGQTSEGIASDQSGDIQIVVPHVSDTIVKQHAAPAPAPAPAPALTNAPVKIPSSDDIKRISRESSERLQGGDNVNTQAGMPPVPASLPDGIAAAGAAAGSSSASHVKASGHHTDGNGAMPPHPPAPSNPRDHISAEAAKAAIAAAASYSPGGPSASPKRSSSDSSSGVHAKAGHSESTASETAEHVVGHSNGNQGSSQGIQLTESERRAINSFSEDKEHLLVHVKQIRSEQQLATLIEYIQDGYIAIEQADNEKRRLKKSIKGWNASFEDYHGRPPTNEERKSLARHMYEDYQRASVTLKIRCDKVNKIMDTVGLTHQGFLKLRDKYYEWRESQEEEAEQAAEQAEHLYLK